MRFLKLLLCFFVLGAFTVSPSHATERYLDRRFRDLAGATTTAPASSVVVPGNPCLAWGCPSLNTACPAGTTGPAGASASSCVVDYLATTVNLNLASSNTATIDYFANAQITGSVLDLAGENMNTDFAAYPSGVSMANANTVSINCTVICVSCGTAALQAAAESMMGFMPPYAFSQMNFPINSISTCMSTEAVNGVCATNINAVVGNPAAPCTTNCGGSSGGVSTGVIIGAIAGGLVTLIVIIGGIFWYRKRTNNFSTATRNISSSNAGPVAVVSGPMSANNVGMNYNPSPQFGAQQANNMQMQQMNMNTGAPAGQMRNYNNTSPRGPQAIEPAYGQVQQQQNWNNNNRQWS